MKTSARHDDWLMAKLADADFAAEYLNAASEDDDPKTYSQLFERSLRPEAAWLMWPQRRNFPARRFTGRSQRVVIQPSKLCQLFSRQPA